MISPLWLLSLPDVDPLPQPGPSWAFRVLLLVTFFLHLVPMNLVLGGSVVALVTRLGRHDGDGRAARVAAWFTKALPTLIAATVTFGVAPLLFLQVLYGRVFFSSAVLMAWPWLGVVPLLVIGYYASYRAALAPPGRHLLLSAIVTALVITVSVIYSNNMSLMLRAERFADVAAGGVDGWWLNAGDPTLVPRYLHTAIGTVAVAGAGLAALGLAWRRDRALGEWAMRRGSAWMAAATLANLAAGFWWVLALPRDVLLRFMGRDPLAATVLMLGIVLGMTALAAFAFAWRAANPAPAVTAGVGALACTLVAMVVSRDQVRESALALMGFEANPWVQTQWVPMGLFVLLLVGAFATVIWMAGLLARGAGAPD